MTIIHFNQSDYLQLISIGISAFIAIGIYLLQKRLTDKQRLDHRLEIEEKAQDKLSEMQKKGYNSKINLYNVKLLNKKYFSINKRSRIWGYPYHSAGLYSVNFDGIEFVINTESWKGKDYYKVGVIPFENILGIKPDGDGTFGGMILYVKPKLIQKDKYSIAYKSFRYYPVRQVWGGDTSKPFKQKLIDSCIHIFRRGRYLFYYKWRRR